MTKISSEGITRIYKDKIWKLHRIPKKILSDRGPQFVSRFMEELTKALRTKIILSTVYHPQSDGQTKRINQGIGTFLWHYINYQQNNWTEWITVAEFHYNDKKHTATKQTPFILKTIINEEEEHEVEEVQKHRKWDRETQYLVYWKGYGDKHDQ